MGDPNRYEQFIASKVPVVQPTGFDPRGLSPGLFPFQRDLVRWALRLGRAALFADCGLGKSYMQLEWAQRVCEETGGKVLILAPLAVTGQTVREGERFGIPVAYARETPQDLRGITITNYECLEHFDPRAFAGVVLDESSILKSFMGKTKRALVDAFAETRFKLACTATPSPNDVMELGNHCEFLGVMDSHEMLTRWFINDTMAAGHYRLKGHAEADFWRWVATWAACVAKPSDLLDAAGQPYDATGYELPELELVEHVVKGPPEVPTGGELFGAVTVNATTLHKQSKRTLRERCARAAELVAAEPDEPWVVWCHTNDEADELQRLMPEALEVRGSDSPDEKERKLLAFSDGAARVIITKASIAGHGLNWQHCARHAYVGVSYSYEDFYQALRRSYRFGQQRAVRAHIIVSGVLVGVRAVLAQKQELHRRQQERMSAAMREVHLEHDRERLAASIGPGSLRIERGEGWELHLGDCVEAARGLRSNTMGLSVFSPPFSSLYTYSASLRDMGNCSSDGEFFEHFSFLIPELLRITVPGRLCAVHTKDLPRYRGATGASGLRDFTGEVTRAFESAQGEDGSRWVYHSKVTIWKCPVTEMQRTKSHGLLYKTLRADASFSRQGCPDYLVVFRKWSPEEVSADPVNHTVDELPLALWQKYASPVWMDIDQTDVLNTEVARTDKDEKHICLARGSLVLTYDGYRPIEDLQVGERVLTHEGRWRAITAKVCNGVRPVVRTTAQGVADLRTTPDHKLWVRRAGQDKHRARRVAAKASAEWVQAADTLGSYVNLKLPPVEESKLSAEDWWTVGRWLGDGHFSTRGLPFITCAFAETQGLLAKLGRRAGGVYSTQTAHQVYVKGRGGKGGQHNDPLHLMIKRCGEGAHAKRVPGEALALNAELAAALLDGYLSADGHTDCLGRRSASSVSRPLALGMAIVAQRAHGTVASVYAGRAPGETTIQGRRVKTRQEWILSLPPQNRSAFLADDGAWKKVREVEAVGEAEVWDIKVEDDASFTAEGCIVHNCPLQLGVIERCVHLWSNPGDRVFSPFAGIGSEGHVSLKLGRKFTGVELKPEYFERARRNLVAATSQLDLFGGPTPAEVRAS